MQIGSWMSRHLRTENDWNTVPQDRDKHTIVAATATGAAVGAVAGTIAGVAQMERQETMVTTDIVDPEFLGYKYRRTEDTSTTCYPMGEDQEMCIESTDGYRHRYTPQYNDRVVGTYERPEFFTSDKLAPLKGAALGAIGGGLLGLVTGIGINLVRKTASPDLPPAQIGRRKSNDLEYSAPSKIMAGTIGGAVVGGVVGVIAGSVEQSSNDAVTRSFTGPVTVNTEMGLVPPYQYTGGRRDLSGAAATEPVYRDVPVYDGNGQVQMESKTEEFSTARYGRWSGLGVGALVGAGVGLVGGIATNVLTRMSNYQKPQAS